ncbi:hypothetical protein [Halocatena halophila]|uniref:hypothetical protein n=1 Tax=Halocatena halophila TaxID=2814576 RepID=UPI002ED01D52
MSEDNCTATKNDGEPCTYSAKYPDGKCGVHTDCIDPDPGGRPSKYNDERARAAIEAAREGKSRSGCARAAGVDEGTIRNWLSDREDFFRAYTRARAKGESRLIRGGLHDPDVDSSFAKFLLASSFDYATTEKREHSGPGGDSIPVEQEHSTTLSDSDRDFLDSVFGAED